MSRRPVRSRTQLDGQRDGAGEAHVEQHEGIREGQDRVAPSGPQPQPLRLELVDDVAAVAAVDSGDLVQYVVDALEIVALLLEGLLGIGVLRQMLLHRRLGDALEGAVGLGRYRGLARTVVHDAQLTEDGVARHGPVRVRQDLAVDLDGALSLGHDVHVRGGGVVARVALPDDLVVGVVLALLEGGHDGVQDVVVDSLEEREAGDDGSYRGGGHGRSPPAAATRHAPAGLGPSAGTVGVGAGYARGVVGEEVVPVHVSIAVTIVAITVIVIICCRIILCFRRGGR